MVRQYYEIEYPSRPRQQDSPLRPPATPPGVPSEAIHLGFRDEDTHLLSESMSEIGLFTPKPRMDSPNPTPLELIRRSPSPDMKGVLEEDATDESEQPILIRVPQLSSPLAFSQEALKFWGRAHVDYSEQSVQFHTQLHEWKMTKVELRQILAKAYEDTRLLKEHVVSNEVTQEHLYALHIQVKCMAKQVREASRNVDRLINTVLKQMTLNVDAIRDFGTMLRAIPFDTLTIQDFYRSLRSFYIGLLERLVEHYGKNNPFIINVAHAFEHFLQMCDFIEPLPDGLAQFTGMMSSIIHDVYHVDLDLRELKQTAREMKGGTAQLKMASPSTSSEPAPALSREEMKEVLHNVHTKHVAKRDAEDAAACEAKMDHMFSKITDPDLVEEGIKPELKAALVEAMRQDEREIRIGKIKIKGQRGEGSKDRRVL